MEQSSDLPVDSIIEIEERLVLYVDKVRFRSVCMSWNSYLPNIKFPKNNQGAPFPCLLHPLSLNKDEAEADAEASHCLFCPIESRIYHFDLPDAKGVFFKGVFFKGSSYGWVATIPDTVTGTGSDMYLLNPLTRARIQLPPRSKFPDVAGYHSDQIGTESEYTIRGIDGDSYDVSSYDVHWFLLDKVVLSSTPSEDCVVVAIYGELGRLAYCKCNDTEWKFLFGDTFPFVDAIFHKGKLHALDLYGQVFVFESIGHSPQTTVIRPTPILHGVSRYLVESSDGELMMALRHHINTFTIYKLDPTNSTWVHLNHIGDDMLFLGWNSSLALPSRDFSGHKGNCIYFTDGYTTYEQAIDEGVFVGVFDLEHNCSVSLPGCSYDPILVWPPPVWVTPCTL